MAIPFNQQLFVIKPDGAANNKKFIY